MDFYTTCAILQQSGARFDNAGDSSPKVNVSDSEHDSSMHDSIEVNLELIKWILQGERDAFEAGLLGDVLKALEVLSSMKFNRYIF
ncbi:Hypothetical predicted protein [Olea europaea subsp. europaea]|uniref:Uncharacterized protein n=1 Tax=Olea europaea subsp. europaea TaxID=158383 RepID=A0A8S0UNJ2_OLEEU|nr:Hypothetical predicted protein [Olea europaea subsp. europaea]